MKTLKAIIAFISLVFCGLSGGQGRQLGKSPRRFGIPVFSTLFGLSTGWNWKYLAFLFLAIPLSLGYGENSKLMEVFGNDTAVRVVYALLLSIPFYIFTWRRGLFASVALVAAFQIHAGSLGYVEWFGDWLIEDIVRYSTLAALVLFNVMFKRKD